MIEKAHQFFNTKISAAPLVSFRLIFGALMVFSAIRFMYLGWIEDHFTEPLFHFKYYGFSWVKSASRFTLYAIHMSYDSIGHLVSLFLQGNSL